MGLVGGTGYAMGKNKAVVVVLTGFTGTGTSVFGDSTDVNCTGTAGVEFLSVTKPEKSENQSEEIQTNMRTIKDDVGTDAWEDWDGLEVFSDEDGVNWKAFVAAQETDATGTVTIKVGTATLGSWTAKISKAGGGGGDASAFDTSFNPTIRLLSSLSLT